MRYEILYKFGGFMADADSICLHAVDELLVGTGAYTVYDHADTGKSRCVSVPSCRAGKSCSGSSDLSSGAIKTLGFGETLAFYRQSIFDPGYT
jgi:hypothetical protein